MDTIYKRMNDDLEIIRDCDEESEVQKFYAGKILFITGSTGFMGKCLIEKLLRSCPDLKLIYVMVRPKKGTSAEERVKQYLDDVLFSVVRKMYPDCGSKIHLIEGDLVQDGMALSDKDKNTLIEEVNIMIHNASNVKFTERMCNALRINVLGTKSMIDLAKQCKRIEGFLYVSTAYSHCYKKIIKEEAYPSPADLTRVRDLIATDMATPKGLDSKVISDIIGEFPNTYTFTKAIAEGLVNDVGKEVSFPCIVYRPSIVVSTWKEPIRGWCGNLNGPAMLLIGYGLGIIHVAYKPSTPLDMVPADMSINAIIVSIWDAAKNRSNVSQPIVYNYASSSIDPMSLSRLDEDCFRGVDGVENPSIMQLWHPFKVNTHSAWQFGLGHLVFHFVPALLADTYFLLKGMQTQALDAFKKVAVCYKLLLYFISGGWLIEIPEMIKVFDRMSSIDRELFFCDIRELDWADYCLTYPNGIRVYVLNDPMSTLPAARRKARIFSRIHYTLKYILMSLIVYVIVSKLGLL